MYEADVLAVPRFENEERWPEFVAAAREKGVRAQIAVKIYLDDQGTLGSLNVYSNDAIEITHEQLSVAKIFATHAALAMGKIRESEHLHRALETRQEIGQAVGLLITTYRLDPSAAFAFLARVSSHRNVKIRDVATQIVEQHLSQIKSDGDVGPLL